MKPGGSIWRAVKNSFVTEDVFLENEAAANILTAKTMLLLTGSLFLTWILNRFGIFALDETVLNGIVFWSALELTLPACICLRYRGQKRWLKYLLMLEFTIVQARVDSVLSYNVALAMLIPLILSCRYYSKGFTAQIAVFSTILFGVSAFCGAWFDMAEYNPLYGAPTKAGYTWNVMTQFFGSKMIIFILVAVICMEISKWGRRMVLNQADISKEHSRVETELEMAKRIQARALPIVHSLPRQEVFDLAATMTPAREVGGDFYDFFYLDPTHLVLMIADVSGKGVPAALFMMASKLLLDNSVASGKTPGQVLAEVNHQLCEKNLENMFVTVWLGILDLETGDLTTANAGHEYPLLCRKDGTFELIKDKHGFVLGGMDGMRYKETKLHLDPGDVLLVYTDGVPEANNQKEEQFGMEKTIQSLNSRKDGTMEELTRQLKADIDSFAEGAPQFDDTTMLAVRLLAYGKSNEIHTNADEDSIEKTEDFVRETLEAAELPMRLCSKVNVIVDEIYSNIVRYSGAARASVKCIPGDGTVTLEFRDNGTPYDPTKAKTPDITTALDDREIGGLGIFMTQKLASSMEYRHESGENILTITV